MDTISRIKGKIDLIEKLLGEIKLELESLSEDQPKVSKTPIGEIIPPDDQLINEYNDLYLNFVNNDFTAIVDYIKGKNKLYLKAFCKANKLPLDVSKASKDRIIDEILQWMRQRQAITKKTEPE